MWTINQAVKALNQSASVNEAAATLGTTPASLRGRFQRANIGSPAKHIGVSHLSEIERVLVCPDAHIPFHDERAWGTFLVAAYDWKPDTIVFLGDLADCYEVSDYTKSPTRKHNFASEMQAVNDELDRVARAKRTVVLLGNHEDRLDRLIAKRAPELHGLTSIPKLLRYEDRGWEWIPYGEQLQIGKIRFAHDYGVAGANAVRQSLAATGHCVLFGHTHRAGIEYSGTVDGERHVGMSCGWLGDYDSLAFSYTRRWKAKREWTHGFSTVQIERATGYGFAQFHPIIDGRTVIDGQTIRG